MAALEILQGSHGPACLPGTYFETLQVFSFCGICISYTLRSNIFDNVLPQNDR